MTPDSTRRLGPPLILAIVVLFFVATSTRWIWLYCHGMPLDIDAAGYLCIAFRDYFGLIDGGLAGWFATIAATSSVGPMTPALASLLFYLTGPHVIAGYAVPLIAGAVVIVVTYWLGTSILSQQVGITASVLVASCPVIVNFSREFHFSIPATAVTTTALLALVKSQRFARLGWAITFGLCTGLMPLARTMTLAFMPGVLIAGFAYTVVEATGLWQRLGVLFSAVIVAIATTAIGLGPSWTNVIEYLLSFGYGIRAAEYGPPTSLFGFEAFALMVRALVFEIYLPHFLIMVAGITCLLLLTISDAARNGTNAAILRTLRSRLFPIVIFLAEALLALTSSRNKGSAFYAPIVPAAMIVTVWPFYRLALTRSYSRLVTCVITIVVLVAAIPLVDLRTAFARPWSSVLPILGSVPVSDGRGAIQNYFVAGGLGNVNLTEPLDGRAGMSWIENDIETAGRITDLSGPGAIIAFGFRHRLFNVNTVNLQHVLRTGTSFGGRQIEPFVAGGSVEGYLKWLVSENVGTCVLLTSNVSVSADFQPAVNRASMTKAAKRAGFVQVDHWRTPDGQIITLWRPMVTPPNCIPPDTSPGKVG